MTGKEEGLKVKAKALAMAAAITVGMNGFAEIDPVWDLAKDAGPLSAQLAKEGSIPFGSAHRFEVPQVAIKDSTAFTVEMKFRTGPDVQERTFEFIRQSTSTTGFSLSFLRRDGGGNPIALRMNGTVFGAGGFRPVANSEHTIVITARKGLTVLYVDKAQPRRFFNTIIPNLEPIVIGGTQLDPRTKGVTEVEGMRLTSLKFWGPEMEYYAPGESREFADGFRGGKGWLMNCPPEDPAKKLPRILCYGDSILGGYGPRLRKRLEGKAYVYTWSKFEGGAVGERLWSAPYAAACKVQPFDCIVFNNGLHSLHWTEDKVSDELLKATQRQIYRNFRDNAPQAKIWWLSTTPHTSREKNAEGQVFKTGELDPVVLRINRLTAEVMAEEKVPVLDGYGALSGHLDLACGDGYHWKGAGYDRLVDLIAAAVFK